MEGLDKTDNYNFVYRQHVIKPVLISILGAWISGGVEWNIPHHHRATTFDPVQYTVENNADGSKTVWVGELELRQRMRWAVGYTLRPGKSYLEAKLRILNREPEANTMLCFANVAVHVNDNYQIIFPPSTQFGTGHSKTAFQSWPIDDSGVDISWYKNHPTSGSVFAWNYADDFFAGYDHGKEAGIMSIADHNVVPGKKFFTWGTRDTSWRDALTDSDGPYIELMAGAYSDNQPDYSWLQPYEVRSFSMNWYPFRGIGGVKQANLEAAVNLEVTNNTATVGFCTTSAHPEAKMMLKAGQKVLLEETSAINPGKPYVKQVSRSSRHRPARSPGVAFERRPRTCVLLADSPATHADAQTGDQPGRSGGDQDRRRTLPDRSARLAISLPERGSRSLLGRSASPGSGRHPRQHHPGHDRLQARPGTKKPSNTCARRWSG